MRDVKEKICYIAVDCDVEMMKLATESSVNAKTYELQGDNDMTCELQAGNTIGAQGTASAANNYN